MTEADYQRISNMNVYDDIEIPVDGTIIRASRYEPIQVDSPQPTVLIYTPYHKDDLSNGRSDPLVSYLANHGYEVLIADLAGTGASDGLAAEPFSEAEGVHGAAVVEWAASQGWCSGAVGVIGKSYPGTTALEIAAEDPTGLEAIVPIHAPTRTYDSYFDGGALAFLRTCGLWAPNFEYLPAQPPSRRDGDGKWASLWETRLSELKRREPYLFQYLSHSTKDEYWARKDVPVEQITTPTLAVGGYQDAFAEATIKYADQIDAPTRLILGPWRHALPEAGETGTIDFLGEVEAWFDTYLRDEDTDVLRSPPVRHWTATPSDADPLGGCWRGRETWPTVESAAEDHDRSVSFSLTDTGLTTDAGEITAVSDGWTPDFGVGVNSVGFEVPGGTGLDTTPDDVRSLTYETDVFSTPFELTGSGHARLAICPESEDQLVAVRLIDVAPDGTGQLVTHGVVRASLAHDEIDPAQEGGTSVQPLVPDETTDIDVSLRPTSHVFQPGHRLRIAVSGAYFPYVLPPTESGGFRLHSSADNSSVCVLPGEFRDDVSFDDGYTFDSPQREYVQSSAPIRWETKENHSDDVVTVSLEQSYKKPLPTGTFEYEMEVQAQTHRTQPTSGTIDRKTTTTLQYPTQTVVTHVHNTTSATMATMSYHVTIDGETVFEEQKQWSPDEI